MIFKMTMKQKARKRIFIAWLLLLTMMPFFWVKAFHYHKINEASVETNSTNQHGGTSDACLICQFMLSPFTEATTFTIQLILSFVYLNLPVYCTKPCICRVLSLHLRAPPVLL